MAYEWPGNVRELKNAVERGVILNSDTRIDVDHLPSSIQTFYRAADIGQLAICGGGSGQPMRRRRAMPFARAPP